MTSPYASRTSVPEDRSRSELEKLLRKYGATQFGYAWDDTTGQQQIMFGLTGRTVRMEIPMPDPDDPLFTRTPGGKLRSDTAAKEEYARESRRRWRALVMVTKAKLVAVSEGITTLDREFLADVVTENGKTVGEVVRPWLAGSGALQISRGRASG